MRPRDPNKATQLKLKAITMVVNNGIEEFGVNKLARETGLSPGTIYNYFEDKEELLRTICLEVSSEILVSSLRGLEPEMKFEEGMRLQWKNRLDFYKEFPEKILFMERVRYTSIYESILTELTKSSTHLLSEFINKAVAEGKLAKMPFEMYWSFAFAPLYQMINFSRLETAFKLTDQLLDDCLDRALRSLSS